MRRLGPRVMGIALFSLILAAAAIAQDATAPAETKTPAAASQATPADPGKAAQPGKAPETAKATAAVKPGEPRTAEPKTTTSAVSRSIVGEVVDPACWIINGAKGKGHAECAAACAKAGQTLAILEVKTNKLYILAGENPGQDPNKGVMEFIGEKVLVKGRVFSRQGALGIQVASVEPYNPKMAAQAR